MPLRILVVKLSAVGDVIHALPALSALREHFPDAKIGWAVHPGPANLLEHHPQLDELMVVQRRIRGVAGFKTVSRDLKSKGWDIAIDFQGLTKSGIVSWLSGAPRRIGFKGPASREINRLFMTERVRPSSESVIRMNLDLLRPLGISDALAQPVLHPTNDDRCVISNWASQGGVDGEKFLLIDPFAGWQSKTWPEERWCAVASHVKESLGLRTVIFFGPAEKDHAEHLQRKMGKDALTAPPTTLRQSIALFQQHAAVFVAGDTGPMHLAAAAGIPTVALFGPSCSRRNAPCFEGARFEVLQDFSQPCTGTFKRKCKHHPPGHCLDGISSDEVVQSILRLKSAG